MQDSVMYEWATWLTWLLFSPDMIWQRKECCQRGVHLSSSPFVFLGHFAQVKIHQFFTGCAARTAEMYVTCQGMFPIAESQEGYLTPKYLLEEEEVQNIGRQLVF